MCEFSDRAGSEAVLPQPQKQGAGRGEGHQAKSRHGATPWSVSGYNAATGEYGDMLAMGILDPTKVTRTALQNAASIAGLMSTTEAMVAEAPKKDEPAMGGGGGMGGMGGMDF